MSVLQGGETFDDFGGFEVKNALNYFDQNTLLSLHCDLFYTGCYLTYKVYILYRQLIFQMLSLPMTI